LITFPGQIGRLRRGNRLDRLESLFLTLPTRALTGQQIMSSAG
jgi:hypothetical protein